MERLYLTMVLAVFGTINAQTDQDPSPLSVRFLEPNATTTLLSKLRIVCEININLERLINDFDVEIVRQSAENKSEIVLSRGAKKIAPEGKEHYSVMISVNTEGPEDGIKIKFEFLTVRDQDEGKYFCRVKPNSNNDTVLGEDSMDIVVLKPVENIYVKFGNYDPVSSSKVDPIEVDTGKYPMVCTAEGSNPAPTVHLYLDGKQIQKVVTQTDKMVSQSTKFRTVVTANVSLPFSNSVHTVECAAEAQVGNTRSVKLSFKTKLYDPEITCNDTEAYPGQKQPILTCTVDYEGVRIKSFRYELGDTDNRHSGATNADFEQVSQEHLSDTKTRVHLKLKMAKDWHFETEFYLVVEHEDGHITRQTVRLHKIPGYDTARDSGDSHINSGPALIVFFTCFMLLL